MFHFIKERPKFIRSGEPAFFSDRIRLERREELELILAFITKRELFGRVYEGIDPVYFRNMPSQSGVFILPILPTPVLLPGVMRPGDIDLLIIPYEHENLLLHKVFAVEVKIIRASYKKQGKSPNEFGFTQASQLISIGFPNVAVIHIIVSDRSPADAWREVMVFQVIDQFDRVKPLPPQKKDMMPADLIGRAYGRLAAFAPDTRIGLAAVYLGADDEEIAGAYKSEGLWLPFCRRSKPNENFSTHLLNRIGEFFDKNSKQFLDNPRFDP